MRYPDRKIRCVGDLLGHLKGDFHDENEPIWYRGQSSSEWSLNPKLLRYPSPPPESHLLNRFRQNASYILQQPQSSITDFDWLFLMQHHGAPTRLLDWTESALVGLYFSCITKPEKDGALWVLSPCELNSKSNYTPEYRYEIPSFEDDQLINYSPKTIAGETKTRLLPMAAIAVRNSPRMHAQQGVFTVAHRGESKLDDLAKEDGDEFLWRFLIPGDAKEGVLRELSILGFGRFQLFPDLSSIAEGVMG